MVTWYWSADNLIWQVSIDHNMMSYIKIVHSKPRLHVSEPIIWRMATILHDSTLVITAVMRMHPQAILLATITTRKSIHGFPLVSYMGMGLRLAALRPPELCYKSSSHSKLYLTSSSQTNYKAEAILVTSTHCYATHCPLNN